MNKHWMLPLALSLLATFATAAHADETSTAEQLEDVKEELTGDTYLLQYKLQEGETIRAKVVHIATTETKIRGTTQKSQSRSVSTKVWKVTKVEDNGNMTFTHSVSDIEMWQKVSDRPEIRYDSQSGDEPPPEYQAAAKTVGVPLSTVTIMPDGRIISRDSDKPRADMGIGQMVVPLPVQPVTVGTKWHVPDEIQVRLPDLQVKTIKTRRQFKLEKVETGVATILAETQVLTPVSDAQVKSQLIQQLTRGVVKFDVDAGRILSQQFDWDETVIGFNGAESIMQYLARFTEELLPEEKTARKQ